MQRAAPRKPVAAENEVTMLSQASPACPDKRCNQMKMKTEVLGEKHYIVWVVGE